MREYERPVAVVNDELAEGVYMASGDTVGTGDSSTSASNSGGTKGGITVTKGTENDWGQDNCQVTFKIALPDGTSGHKKIVISCNQKVVNAWGGGGSVECSGKKVTLDIWNVAAEFEVTIVGNTGLDVTGTDVQDA